MAVPTVYRSDDPGAPVAHGNSPGSLLDVFQKCLVDGYGAKPAAGWTQVFSGTNKAAFRSAPNSEGYDCVVRLDDSATTGYRQMLVSTFATMSDIDNGVSATEVVRASRNPGSTSTMVELDWFVVADDKRFYASAKSVSGNAYSWMLGAGLAKSFSLADAFAYFAFGQHATSDNSPPNVLGLVLTGAGPIGIDLPSASGLSLGRAYTGIGGVSRAGILRPASVGSNAQYVGGNAFVSRPSENAADEAAMPVIIVQNTILRGRLPGLYLPIADCRAFPWRGENTTALFGGAGSVSMLLEAGNATQGALWVETALDWGD